LDVDPLVKLREKATAFNYSDGNTPIMGQFVTKVVDMLGEAETNHLQIWNADHTTTHYPNAYGQWMVEEVNHQLPEMNMDVFEQWLFSIEMPEDLLCPPLILEPMPATPATTQVLVDDEEIAAKPAVDDQKLSKRKRKRRTKKKQ
jgi:hypothetical protein